MLGNVNDEVNFNFGNAEAASGCGTMFKGEYWYFGGYSHHRNKVSRISLNKIRKIINFSIKCNGRNMRFLIYLRLTRLKDVPFNNSFLLDLTSNVVHVIHSALPKKKYYFVSLSTQRKYVEREFIIIHSMNIILNSVGMGHLLAMLNQQNMTIG